MMMTIIVFYSLWLILQLVSIDGAAAACTILPMPASQFCEWNYERFIGSKRYLL